MKKFSKLIAALAIVLAAALLASSALPALVNAEAKGKLLPSWTVPEGYNAHDYEKCVNFLEQTDENGVKNGDKLSDNYDPNDPGTWGYFIDEEYGEGGPNFTFENGGYGDYYIWWIQPNPSDLVGKADFSGCFDLMNLNLKDNRITELNVSGCTYLDSLWCSGNLITELDFSSNTYLGFDHIRAEGNGYIGYAFSDLYHYDWDINDGDTDNKEGGAVFAYPQNGASFEGFFDASGALISSGEWSAADNAYLYEFRGVPTGTVIARFSGESAPTPAPTETPAPVDPTDEPAPVDPTDEPAPVEPTDEPAPVEPTDEPAPVEPTQPPVPIDPIQNGVSIALSTNKDSYSSSENINAVLTVTNANSEDIYNVFGEIYIPIGYKVADGSSRTLTAATLQAGGTITLNTVFTPVGTPVPPATGDGALTPAVIVVMLAIAGGAAYLLIKQRKTTSRIAALVLCAAMAAGAFAGIGSAVKAETEGLIELTTAKSISIDGNPFTLQARATFGGENSGNGTIHTVTFDSMGGSAVPAASVPDGQTAPIPESPERSDYMFLAWYENRDESDMNNIYMFNEPVHADITLYAKWISTIDTDGDGLVDGFEEFYGTDINNPDTDGDGLGDGIEVISALDPLSVDTDGNGVTDPNEDLDSDGLINLREAQLGTSLTMADTDADGLIDGAEVNTHNTDPLNGDTDGDGASDGAEVRYGENPLATTSIFNITLEAEDENNDNSGAYVRVSLNADQVDSLVFQETENEELDDEGIPGYTGEAYDFYVDGETGDTVIVVQLPPANDDVVYQIYYYNETEQTFDEVETTVENGAASATVTNNGSYILLDKNAVDAIWDQDIKPPTASDKTLEMVFVIDRSKSMSWNDPNMISRRLTKTFIMKMRDDDEAALVTFTRVANLLSDFSKDKEHLCALVDSFTLDSGYETGSGTDGSAGLNAAINLFSNYNFTDDVSKIIIFLTDGEDNGSGTPQYSYNSIIERANLHDITIYSVGMDTSNQSVLQALATGTGGKYYYAYNADALDDIYDAIMDETVDFISDSNDDGISDYYTRLLCDGTMRLSNGKLSPFFGLNYEDVQNGAIDFDNDGLPNGRNEDHPNGELEVIISHDEQRVYVKMHSDPTKKDTDDDGFDDAYEIRKGSDPLKWDISDRDLALLASAVYYDIPIGSKLDELPAALEDKINTTFIGTDGFSVGEIKELKGWEVVGKSGDWSVLNGFYAAAYKKDNNIVVAYRGSHPLAFEYLMPGYEEDGWDIFMDWFINNTVSAGVFGAGIQVNDAINTMEHVLNAYPQEENNFFIVGHSLGGYLAYCGGAKALNERPSAIAGIMTFNGLGLCPGLTGMLGFNGFFERAELLLTVCRSVITNHMVSGDFVSNGIVDTVTSASHYGLCTLCNQHPAAPSKHSMFNFIAALGPDGRF